MTCLKSSEPLRNNTVVVLESFVNDYHILTPLTGCKSISGKPSKLSDEVTASSKCWSPLNPCSFYKNEFNICHILNGVEL